MNGAFKDSSQDNPHLRAEAKAKDLKRALHKYVFNVDNPVPPVSEAHLRKNSEGFDWCIQINAKTPEQKQKLFDFFHSLQGTHGIALSEDGEESRQHDFYFNNDVVVRATLALEKLSAPKAACKLEMNIK